MKQNIVNEYLALYERAGMDEQYRAVLEELRRADGKLLRALEEMAPRHRDAVMDYLGIAQEANRLLLTFALRSGEKC
jgi:hypothetical protein